MSETPSRFDAAIVGVAPFVLLAAIAYHPFVGNLTNRSEVAAAINEGATRWSIAHVAVGVGMGLLLLAFLAVCTYLQRRGETCWSEGAVPFLVMGTTFTLFLPAMETAVGAAAQRSRPRIRTCGAPACVPAAHVRGSASVRSRSGPGCDRHCKERRF